MMNNFRKDSEVIDWLLSGSRLNRPVKEWERRAIFRKIGKLKADATEREDFAFRTTSNAMAKKSEEAARDLRAQADVLEKNANRLGIKQSKRPTMEGRIVKITERQLRRIIREALGDRGDLPRKKQYQIGKRGPEDLPRGNVTSKIPNAKYDPELPPASSEKQWLEWAEGYGMFPEVDNEDQMVFYFEMDDDVDGTITSEAEMLGGDLQPAGMVPDGNMVIYTGVYR